MKRTIFFAALLSGMFCLSACMDSDWKAPDFDGNPPYGNNNIVPSNETHITIAGLKAKYANVFSQKSGCKKVEEDLQLHVVVNGNDQGGNLYKQISVQDETGGIIIGINATDMFSKLPVGQKLIINLKGLYVGTYGSMAQIGSLYNSGLGRMELQEWLDNVRLIMGNSVEVETIVNEDGEEKKETIVIPMTAEVDTIAFAPTGNHNNLIGRIVKLENVTVSGDGTQILAPDDGSTRLTSNCANRDINGSAGNKAVLRTSTYSDFAARKIPTGKVDIYGVCTYYNGTWQILMRTNSDMVEKK